MLNSFIWSMVKMDFRLRYDHWSYYFAHAFTLILSLAIYWFTSKAFSPALDPGLKTMGTDYFTYLIIGEVFLALPFHFMETLTSETQRLHHEQIWDTVASLPISKQGLLAKLSLKGLPREIATQTIFLFMAQCIFTLRIEWSHLFKALVFLSLFIIVFILTGLIFSAIIFFSGRGKGLLGHFNSLNAFLAGSFFPMEVFPETLRKSLYFISPYTFFLENMRAILSGKESNPLTALSVLILYILILGLVARAAWLLAEKKVRRQGLPKLIRY